MRGMGADYRPHLGPYGGKGALVMEVQSGIERYTEGCAHYCPPPSHLPQEKKILFLCIIAAPEGIRRVCGRFPQIKVCGSPNQGAPVNVWVGDD